MAASAQPKRHHWWPQVQSRYWTDSRGQVHVTRSDGSGFRSSPTNLGVESELYTRFAEDGSKDSSIEDWFAEAIDAPAKTLIEHFLDSSNISRRPFVGRQAEANFARSVGYRINPYVDFVRSPDSVREAIAAYIAALVVRHPDYLRKLSTLGASEESNPLELMNSALDHMLLMFDRFRSGIRTACVIVERRIGDHEFMFADSGVAVTERWTDSNIPFRIHAPLTPDLSLAVLPLPFATEIDDISIAEATNRAVGRSNRVMLGAAKRFVFSRTPPNAEFVKKNFGVPPPNDIASRAVDGRFEVRRATAEELALDTAVVGEMAPGSLPNRVAGGF